MPPFPETYSGAHGLQLMGALDAAGKLVFTTGNVLAAGRAVSLTSVQVNNVLKRLVAAGWVRRIKRGLFAVTGKLPGSVAAHDFAIATAIHVPSALSHATALNLHGLSEQVPRIITCTTTAKIVTPAMRQQEGDGRRRAFEWNIEGLRIRFVSVVPSRFFGIEDVWVDTRTRVPVTDRERTVLDLFVDPRGRSGINEALGVLEEHASRLDVPKLVSYAARLGVAVPKTYVLPSKDYGPDVSSETLHNLRYPLDWVGLASDLGFPMFLKPHWGGGWRDVSKVDSIAELIVAYDKSGKNTMIVQEGIAWTQYVRCIVVGKERVRPALWDPRLRHADRYTQAATSMEALTPALSARVSEDARKLCRALGYDMNTVEFGIRDGVPYAIDFMNSAPDFDITSLGPEHFGWVVEQMAELVIDLARGPATTMTPAWDHVLLR